MIQQMYKLQMYFNVQLMQTHSIHYPANMWNKDVFQCATYADSLCPSSSKCTSTDLFQLPNLLDKDKS